MLMNASTIGVSHIQVQSMVSWQVLGLCQPEMSLLQERGLEYTIVVQDLFLMGKAALTVHMYFMSPKQKTYMHDTRFHLYNLEMTPAQFWMSRQSTVR